MGSGLFPVSKERARGFKGGRLIRYFIMASRKPFGLKGEEAWFGVQKSTAENSTFFDQGLWKEKGS